MAHKMTTRGVRVYRKLPEGWRINNLATTAPHGYMWIWNGKNLFSKEYRHALMRVS